MSLEYKLESSNKNQPFIIKIKKEIITISTAYEGYEDVNGDLQKIVKTDIINIDKNMFDKIVAIYQTASIVGVLNDDN